MGLLDSILDHKRNVRRMAGIMTPEEEAAFKRRQEKAETEETGRAFSLLNEQLGNDFGDQQYSAATDAAEASPGMEISLADHEVPAMERWKQQVDAMVSSSDPGVQKQGLTMLAKQQEKELAQKPTDVAGVSYAKSLGLKQGTKAFNDFVRSYTDKERKYAPNTVSTAAAKDLEWIDPKNTDPIVGQDWEDIRGKVNVIDDSTAMYESANNAVNTYEEILFGRDNPETGEYEPGIYEDEKWSLPAPLSTAAGIIGGKAEQLLQLDPRYKAAGDFRAGIAAPLIRAMGEKGALSDKDIQRALNLLASTGGLDADTPAVARLKFRYLRSIIDSGKLDKNTMDRTVARAEKEIEELKKKEKPADNTGENPAGWSG